MVGVADSNSVEPTNFLQVFFSELNILLPKAIQSPKKAMVSFDIEVAKQSQFHLMSSSPLSSVDGGVHHLRSYSQFILLSFLCKNNQILIIFIIFYCFYA